MRNKTFASLLYIACFLILFASCQSDQTIHINLENELGFSRVDEPIIIQRAELDAGSNFISRGFLPVLKDNDGNQIPSQIDDLNGDGQWDELFFLYSMDAKSTSKLRVEFVAPEEYPNYEARTNVRFATVESDGSFVPQITGTRLGPDDKPAIDMFHHEGPAWENDIVGFRNYFNTRNSMDIFGKLTTEMVLDSAGIGEDYHFMQDWGMDILMVGNSLGAGALALEKGGNIYRVATGSHGTYNLITQGPLRSIIRLSFSDWQVDGHNYSLTHDIAIWGGAWFYESTVSLSEYHGDETILAGITTIKLEEIRPMVIESEQGITSVATHGMQAYDDGEYLGMAVMVVDGDYLGYDYIDGNGDDIQHSLLVKIQADENLPARFRFYSAWEHSDGKFEDREYFKKLLETEAQVLASPVRVTIR
jgi:hypothetical protein